MSDDVVVRWRGLDEAVEDARRQLEHPGKLEAEFYQVILYRKGDFFRRHRDAKKSRGHVATLSVDLGNALPDEMHWKLRGGGHTIVFDGNTAWDSQGPGSWCCWYNSDLHEIQPCDDTRVVAVYNVCEEEDDDDASDDDVDKNDRTPAVVNVDVQEGLAEARRLAAEHNFRYAGVLLDNVYSFDGAASLAIDRLRGKDQVVADALAGALGQSGGIVVVPARPVSVVCDKVVYHNNEPYETDEVLTHVRIAAAVEPYNPETSWPEEHKEFEEKLRAFEARYGGDFKASNFAGIELDYSFPFFSVPFRDTAWAHDVGDKAELALALADPSDADEDLWGNAATFSVYRYQQAALLVDLVARDADEATSAAADFCAWQRGEAPPADKTPPSYPRDTRISYY